MNTNIIDAFLRGGPVMWPLLLCSLVVLTVVFERFLFWLDLERQRNRRLMDEILTLAENSDWEAIRGKTTGCRDHVIRVILIWVGPWRPRQT
jgi:biopolymer transport protein ExbB